MEAGYTSRPRQTASELRNPKVYPLVSKYIGELEQKYKRSMQLTLRNT